MKEIKQYLSNQKDVYMVMFLNELKAEETNMVMVEHWLKKVVVLSEELEQLNKN
jgi:BarA-like signal transduction histidine kinase